jgi:hypothetical protein
MVRVWNEYGYLLHLLIRKFQLGIGVRITA